ncbi:MAG: HlyC/CorC family transporter [Sphingomonadales bacterium]|nr:HlyC/CorC family transporter [Sphingomonadales bacterium]
MIYFEIALVFLLIVLNGVLAMSELAIVSSRRARLKTMANQRIGGARRALALAEAPGRFLSTVQIGITLVGVLSGAFSGATLGDRFSNWLMDNGMSANMAYVVGVGVIVTAITYLSLIIGELVPKQIALRNPEAIAVRVAPAMMLLSRIAAPVVWVLDHSGNFVLRLLGRRPGSESAVTEEEIKLLVMEAERAGVLESAERNMITSVLRLGDRPVRVAMTPRGDVDMINVRDKTDKIIADVRKSPHSRLPAHEGNPDDLLGILWVKDLIGRGLADSEVDIRALLRQAPVIPDAADMLDALEILRKSDIHMGLVHDEYGSFEGVITSADILESIVGAFRAEAGMPEPGIVTREDGSLLISGWLPLDEFAERLGLPLEKRPPAETAAGFVIHAFGVLPKVGDAITSHGYRFEVVDLDGRRIDKILATRLD